MKTSNLKFTIDDISLSGDNVEVSYFINDDDLLNATISYLHLKEFAASMGMNSYCDNELTGDYKYYDIDIYIAENIEEVVKYFLQFTYNPFDAYKEALTRLIAEFGKEAA